MSISWAIALNLWYCSAVYDRARRSLIVGKNSHFRKDTREQNCRDSPRRVRDDHHCRTTITANNSAGFRGQNHIGAAGQLSRMGVRRKLTWIELRAKSSRG